MLNLQLLILEKMISNLTWHADEATKKHGATLDDFDPCCPQPQTSDPDQESLQQYCKGLDKYQYYIPIRSAELV